MPEHAVEVFQAAVWYFFLGVLFITLLVVCEAATIIHRGLDWADPYIREACCQPSTRPDRRQGPKHTMRGQTPIFSCQGRSRGHTTWRLNGWEQGS